jgi:protein subunit release factor A
MGVTAMLNPDDLKIEAISAYPPCTGVRVTHIPTGLSVTCESNRWMVENRYQAMRELEQLIEGNNNAG